MSLRAMLIDGGTYISEINRERDRYLAGLISVEEFERRVAKHLGLTSEKGETKR